MSLRAKRRNLRNGIDARRNSTPGLRVETRPTNRANPNADKSPTTITPSKPWPSLDLPSLWVLRHGAPVGEMTIRRQEADDEAYRRQLQSEIGDMPPTAIKKGKKLRAKSPPGVQTNWKPHGVNWRTLSAIARQDMTMAARAKARAA